MTTKNQKAQAALSAIRSAQAQVEHAQDLIAQTPALALAYKDLMEAWDKLEVAGMGVEGFVHASR